MLGEILRNACPRHFVVQERLRSVALWCRPHAQTPRNEESYRDPRPQCTLSTRQELSSAAGRA